MPFIKLDVVPRYFKEQRARFHTELNALNNTRRGSEGERKGTQTSSTNDRVPTESVSNEAPTAADFL